MFRNLKKIAIIVAHPDDEALGMGGSLLKMKKLGVDISILFCTDGISSRHCCDESKKKRAEEFKEAIQFLSPSFYKCLNYPDNMMDSVNLLDIIKNVEEFIANCKPDSVFTHFGGDLNIDHQKVFQAVSTACRAGSSTFVKNILCFEVLSSTNLKLENQRFIPNFYVDIGEFVDQKIDYLKKYASEMRSLPHPRSFENILSLSRLRGAESGVENAEGFMLLRGML